MDKTQPTKLQGIKELILLEKVIFNAYTPSKKRSWEGEVIPIYIGQRTVECEINARGSSFHVLIGKYKFGRCICIPNWDIGTELASLKDIYWNREHLEKYTALNTVDASSIACGIAAMATALET